VFEDNHSTCQRVMLTHRRADVFDQKGRTVLAPEHVLWDMPDHAIPARSEDRAGVVGARRPVTPRVAHNVLDRLADEVLALPAEHTRRRRIDEGGVAFPIDAIN